MQKDPFWKYVKDNFGVTTSEIEALVEDINFWSQIRPFQVKNWIDQTSEIISAIANENASESDFSLFWIRLNELLSTIKLHFVQRRIWKDTCNTLRDRRMAKHIKSGLEMADLLENLVGQFTSDELLFIDYKRQCNSHVFQKGYSVQRKKDPKKKISIRTEYKGKDVREIRWKLISILKTYGGSDKKIAIAFAQRIRANMETIARKGREWLKVGTHT